MDFDKTDWNAMWAAEAASSHWNQDSSKELWNKRADSFSQRINRVMEGHEGLDKDDYISKMLVRIEVKPDWSVLDIGCGPGTLAIPLAKKAKSVVALDISSEMLKHLRANALKNNLANIRYLNSDYQEAFKDRLVEKQDVVVASRSLMAGDMQYAMTQIASVARQAAYVTFPIIHLPFDWEVYQAIGRKEKRHPPFIYIYNMLYQMGVEANVEILNSKIKVQFGDIKEAIEQLQYRANSFTASEMPILRAFLKQKFDEQKDRSVFTLEGFSKWALIWWRNASD